MIGKKGHITEMTLKGEKVTLELWDARNLDTFWRHSRSYYDWMNDTEVVKYLESRFFPQNVTNISSYVEEMCQNKDVFFWGIYENETHVGNVKLGPINRIHRFSEIGIVIGREWQGKGYGSESLKMASDFALDVLGLHKVFGGILQGNTASIKAFEKAGFKEEARLCSQYWNGKEYLDDVIMARFHP